MEKKHYDVGIVGWWYNLNYGGTLTYYALNRALQNMGYSVLMIQHSFPKDVYPNYNTVPFRFAKKYYDISDKYTYGELPQLNKYCDAFLTGSDQMWNPQLAKWSGPEYFLSFAAPDKIKLSYASSFGNVSHCDEEYIKKYNEILHGFDGISVRENYAVDICKADFGLTATQVCDPIFLCEKQDLINVANDSRKKYPEHYVLDFLLDPDPEKVKVCKFVRDKLGLEENVNFTDLQQLSKHVDGYNGEPVNVNYEIEDLVKAYKDADFVITDSFHGTCLALIFNKPFISLANRARGEKRFISLLDLFRLPERLVFKYEDVYSNFDAFTSIDFGETNRLMASERERGLQWLKTILSTKKDSEEKKRGLEWLQAILNPSKKSAPAAITRKDVTSLLDSKMCCGCGSCMSSCPKKAITLQQDQWGYYRSTVNYDLCVDCGLCARACPALQLPKNTNSHSPSCYEFVAADKEVLRRSASGGAFPVIAKEVLAQNGVVVGAAWKDDLTVEHIIVETEADLQKLQKSKYLQSYMGDCFRRVKAYLDDGRMVFFTGTPCQVTGLNAYLQKSYDKLLTADLLCGNAPSTGFFKKYLETAFPEKPVKYEFRYKSDSQRWDSTAIQATLESGKVIQRRGIKNDDYQRVYHNHTMCSYHCSDCRYQAFPRAGDITIGDFWGIERHDPEINSFDGVSIVLTNSSKGERFFSRIPDSACLIRKRVPLEWMEGNGFSRNGGRNFTSPKRDQFYDAVVKKPFDQAVNYALKPNHGEFRSAYHNTNSALRLDHTLLHFRFEPEYWIEEVRGGFPTLVVRENKWKENGHYARLPMAGMLKAGKQYLFSAKVKIKSDSSVLNFHVIDSGSKQLQIIHSENIAGRNRGETWIEVHTVFTPDVSYYDEFMVGAAQVSGPNNFLSIAYLNISEV